MKNKFTNFLLMTVLICAVIAGGVAAFKRINIESNNSAVEFAMDWQDLGKLSVREGISQDILLKKLKDVGLTSIAFTEETLESLKLEGRLAWITGYEKDTLLKLSKASKTNGKISQYVISDSWSLLEQIRHELSIVLGQNRVRYCAPQTLEIIDDEEDLMSLGIGISPQKFKFAQQLINPS